MKQSKKSIFQYSFIPTMFGLLLFLVSVPASVFGLALYDNFSEPVIDEERWKEPEFVREIKDSKLRLKVRSTVAVTSPVMSGISARNPATMNSIEVKVTPRTHYNPSGASVMAAIAGRFYNDGTGSPEVFTGDVQAILRVGGSGQTPIFEWVVVRHNHSTNVDPTDFVAGGQFVILPEIDNTYKLFIGWDGTVFTFKVNEELLTYTPTTPRNSANMPFRGIYTRISANTGKEAVASARFDDFKVNGELYDDFSASAIDTSKWYNYEFVREIVDGRLRLKVRTGQDMTAPAFSGLSIAIPGMIRAMEAKITPVVLQSAPNGTARARVQGGWFYNDGTAGGGFIGDVSAVVGVEPKDGALRGVWYVVKHTDATNPDIVTPIATGTFTKPIVLGSTYAVSLKWDWKTIFLSFDGEEAAFTPTTAINPPNNPPFWVPRTRIQQRDGSDLMGEAYYDDVKVAYRMVQLPVTGQVKCYDATGTEIPCSGTGQDGDIGTGVLWPDPRFGVVYCNSAGPCADQTGDCDGNSSNDVVIDNLTALMWSRNANLPGGTRTWADAVSWANDLTLCGVSGWHLANINELESLVNVGQANQATWLTSKGFTNVQQERYWSSSYNNNASWDGWTLNMATGVIHGWGKGSGFYAWPVHHTSQTALAAVPKTGQRVSMIPGDDGDIRAGVLWAMPRLNDNLDGTVRDNLTSLVWAKDTNAPGPAPCSPGLNKTWTDALAHIQCLNTSAYLGHADWRLPNRKEILSLFDRSQSEPALPPGHPFQNVGGSKLYWTSSTVTATATCAWSVYLGNNDALIQDKGNTLYVWPVRDGYSGPEPSVHSDHYPEGYYALLGVKDTTRMASSVGVTGPGIEGTLELVYADGYWLPPWVFSGNPNPLFLGAILPATPVTYTFTITISGVLVGSHVVTIQRSVSGYVTDFATNLCPTGSVSGPVTFSWTPIANVERQEIELLENGLPIWRLFHLPPSQTSVPYTGPALSAGKAYSYWIVSSIYGNNSLAPGQFSFSEVPVYTLTLNKTGSGTVTSSPTGISCGSVCNATFNQGTPVTLTATPAETYCFIGWSGGGCSGTGTCTVTMNTNAQINAPFTLCSSMCTFTRTLPQYYMPGVAFPVAINAVPSCVPEGQNYWALEEEVPPGWTVTTISDSGTYDPTQHKVFWIISTNASQPRTLSYAITSPAQESGTKTFSGVAAVSGTIYTVGGNAAMSANPGYHPADTAFNWTVDIAEFTAYGAAWKHGDNWPQGWNPIPIGFVTNAAYIWKKFDGSRYQYDPALGAPPACWIPAALSSPAATHAVATTGTATRSLPAAYIPAVPFLVSISVTPSGDTVAYAVEETPPDGWVVSGISESGEWDSTNKKIKWGIFFDANPRTLTYTVTPPEGATGLKVFAGTGSFNGTDAAITGNTAIDVQQKYALTLNKSGNGTVFSSPSGINCGSTCSASYLPGSVVTLTPTADTGNVFAYWSGACTGEIPTCIVTMNADATVQAVFVSSKTKANKLTVTKVKTSQGDGTVTSSDGTINCGKDCVEDFYPNAPVVLTATANPGSTFTGWSTPCSGTGTCTVTMDKAYTVKATFVGPSVLTVTRTLQKKGAGAITSTPDGINCGTTCKKGFIRDTVVTLTATPAPGSTFTGWSTPCSGTGTCTVTMDKAYTIKGTFEGPSVLTVTRVSAKKGRGTVTSAPPGIDCGSTCKAGFTKGATITLTATADPGSVFTGWAAPCSGSGACTVTLNKDTSIKATFAGSVAGFEVEEALYHYGPDGE